MDNVIEFHEHLNEALTIVVDYVILLIEIISVFCVLVGLVRALSTFPNWHSFQKHLTPLQKSLMPFLKMRVGFARWLAIALEFQLGADILETTVEPSTQALIRLSIIAIVRTFLNYFLEKELVAAIHLTKELNLEMPQD